ncbi:MAG TPA: DUF58 domain-containing protein [Candidatus Rubrimentiphilum sp.]|nr:DUF58 domain-containing protein [Candidatus Rubrimentiphilum sp.]
MRAYAPGEEIRAIDWRASARKGSLLVRERGHVPLAWGALLDTSASMRAGRNRSLQEAAQEAVDAWRRCAAAGDRWIDVASENDYGLMHGLDRAQRVMPAHGALLVAGDFFELAEIHEGLLRVVARRLDCTALVARDPWRDGLALAGFVTVADLETRDVRRFFIGARSQMRFQREAGERERAALARLRRAGWRAGTFTEDDGGRALLRAFGAA